MSLQRLDPDNLRGDPKAFGPLVRRCDDPHLNFLAIRDHQLWDELEQKRRDGAKKTPEASQPRANPNPTNEQSQIQT